jgi:hypothetical protein
MCKKKSAIALMTILSVCVTATFIAAASPQAAKEAAAPKRTQEDVNGIIAQQKAKLGADSKVFGESKTYPFFSRYQSPAMRTIKDVELRMVLEGSYAGEIPEDYNTRVVKFAPRKGVDTVEIDPRMPLREWTFTKEGFAINVIPAMFQRHRLHHRQGRIQRRNRDPLYSAETARRQDTNDRDRIHQQR